MFKKQIFFSVLHPSVTEIQTQNSFSRYHQHFPPCPLLQVSYNLHCPLILRTPVQWSRPTTHSQYRFPSRVPPSRKYRPWDNQGTVKQQPHSLWQENTNCKSNIEAACSRAAKGQLAPWSWLADYDSPISFAVSPCFPVQQSFFSALDSSIDKIKTFGMAVTCILQWKR